MGGEDTILFADDDLRSSDDFCVELDRAGYMVERCPIKKLSDTLDDTLQGILIMNVGNNVEVGLAAQQQLVSSGFNWPVIFIADCNEIPEAVRAIKAGVMDFHSTSAHPEDILQSVEEALLRVKTERQQQLQHTAIRQCYASLSPREKDIMKNITDGQTNREIANRLGLSQRTIEVHRAHVMVKMGATCLADLTRMADQYALCSDDNK